MKILITGGLGHIGSKLIREIPKKIKNTHVSIVDNLITQRFFSLYNLKYKKYSFVNLDVSKPSDKLVDIFKDQDIVIHLAAITDAANSFNHAEEVERNNFTSTKNVADICSRLNIKLILLSSTSVYGSQSKLVNEDCHFNDLKPQSPYATSKLKEENYANKLFLDKGLNFTICRFGTIYGVSEGMRFHTAVNKFCWQAVMKEPLTIWKTALNQKRPYLSLNDATDLIIHLIKKNLFHGETYNILTENLTVKQVINEIKKNIHPIKLELVDNKIMNQLSYEVENKKIIETGFKFKDSIKNGIRETIDLIKNSNT